MLPRQTSESLNSNEPSNNYLLFAGDAAGAAGELAGAVEPAGADEPGAVEPGTVGAAGDGAGVGVAAGAAGADDNTDLDPVNIGRPSANASNINATAAPIVIFASTLAVPRGPKAVLDSVFEKSAPASALPGCSRITTIRITHARMNSP